MTNVSKENQLKHTPGRWLVTAPDRIYGQMIKQDGLKYQSHIIAKLVHPIGMSKAEFDANARLIAAAPEMLEALIAIRDVDIDGFRQWAGGYADAIKKAEAAIAKATGQEAGAQ